MENMNELINHLILNMVLRDASASKKLKKDMLLLVKRCLATEVLQSF